MIEGGGRKFCIGAWGSRAIILIILLTVAWFIVQLFTSNEISLETNRAYTIYFATTLSIIGASFILLLISLMID